MDLGSHRVVEGFVDQALALNRRQAFEPGRYHDGPEVSAAIFRASVTGVKMTLIDDVDVDRREAFAKFSFDVRAAIL